MPLFKKRSDPTAEPPRAPTGAGANSGPVSLGTARSDGVYYTVGGSGAYTTVGSGPHYIRFVPDGTLLTVSTEHPPESVRKWQVHADGWMRGRFSFTGDTGTGSLDSMRTGRYSFTSQSDGSMNVTWTNSIDGKTSTRDYVFVPTEGDGPVNLTDQARSIAPTTGQSGSLGQWHSGAELESAVEGAVLYAAACAEVIKRANAAGEEASTAVAARNKAAEPMHELSRQHFEGFARGAEVKFVPLYKAFEEARSTAREIADAFRAVPSSDDVETVLHDTLDSKIYAQTEVAGHILRTVYGPTCAEFIAGIAASNAAIKADVYYFGDDGFIPHVYSPHVADETVCPWCAETIKAAAKVCRFCNREVAGFTNSL